MGSLRYLIKEELRLFTEGIEHVKNLYKSWANKKSGNPEEAIKIMDDVIKYIGSLPKKDFSKYVSYEELKSDLDKITEKQKSKDIGGIYEDDDLLVIAPNTWNASCKYGSSTKWCTTMKDDPSYWRRHNETGTEFFWIFKKKPNSDPGHKYSYHVKINGTSDWCDSVNNCSSDLRDTSYPKQHPKFNEIISKIQEFHDKRNMVDNNAIKERNIRFINSWISDNYDELNTEINNRHDFKGEVEFILVNYITDSLPETLDYYGQPELIDEIGDHLFDTFKSISVDLTWFDNNDLSWLIIESLGYLGFDISRPIDEQFNNNNRISVKDILDTEVFKSGIMEVVSESLTLMLREMCDDEVGYLMDSY